MVKIKKQLGYPLLGICFLVLIASVMVGFYVQNHAQKSYTQSVPQARESKTALENTFGYEGKGGVDALTILKEKTAVDQNTSGLVTSINKRKADTTKKEFWAFYVNGKMASVGPKEYMTKDTDHIEWKIETY